MPLFALANAGVALSVADLASPVTLAIVVGLAIGKPLGVVGFAWLAVRARLASRPLDMTWIMLVGGGLLAGIGFTMALFIADLASPRRGSTRPSSGSRRRRWSRQWPASRCWRGRSDRRPSR